ncbi:uncharacterized protein METZ01_LOCUS408252, partial [marine metagenome]
VFYNEDKKTEVKQWKSLQVSGKSEHLENFLVEYQK